VDDGRSGLDVALQGPQQLRRGRASVAGFEYHQALAAVDGDADAYLPFGEASPHLPEMIAGVAVVERVDLVDPNPARKPRFPLPFGDRREGLPPPEKGRVVVHSDDGGDHVQRDVERHHLKRFGVIHQMPLRPGQKPIGSAAGTSVRNRSRRTSARPISTSPKAGRKAIRIPGRRAFGRGIPPSPTNRPRPAIRGIRGPGPRRGDRRMTLRPSRTPDRGTASFSPWT
jgi:hypothetical protein